MAKTRREELDELENYKKKLEEIKEKMKERKKKDKRENSILENKQIKEISKKKRSEETIRLIRQGDLIDAAELEGISAKIILGHLLELHSHKDNEEYMKAIEEKGKIRFNEKELREYEPRVVE